MKKTITITTLKAYRKMYYQKNKKKMIQSAKNRYAKNPAKYKAYQKNRYKKICNGTW